MKRVRLMDRVGLDFAVHRKAENLSTVDHAMHDMDRAAKSIVLKDRDWIGRLGVRLSSAPPPA